MRQARAGVQAIKVFSFAKPVEYVKVKFLLDLLRPSHRNANISTMIAFMTCHYSLPQMCRKKAYFMQYLGSQKKHIAHLGIVMLTLTQFEAHLSTVTYPHKDRGTLPRELIVSLMTQSQRRLALFPQEDGRNLTQCRRIPPSNNGISVIPSHSNQERQPIEEVG